MLYLTLKVDVCDIFSADISYHIKCYLAYAHPYIPVGSKEIDKRQEHALSTFFRNSRLRILKDKCAYLLHELLEDFRCICEDAGLEETAIINTRTFKNKKDEFGSKISFKSLSKYLIVYASDTNPCDYAIATLHGRGLRDEDLVKAFRHMIRRKVRHRHQQKSEWPLSPEELMVVLDKGPIPQLYNAIYHILKDDGKQNKYGYCITSSQLAAEKIWSLASDRESLIT